MNRSKLALGLSVLSAFVALHSAHAATQLILQGSSDGFDGTLELNLLTDSNGDASQIQTVAPGLTQSYDIAQLATGIVLYNEKGYDILTIKSADFDVAKGGNVEVDYLVNGLDGTYSSLTLDLEDNASKWQALSSGSVVTKAYFKANKLFGQTIGISSISFSP
jgi:hypothetical protein